MSYDILNVLPASITDDEQLGSKNKFWFLIENKRWLFKEARENTGEGWAEKIVSEVGALLNINVARVELASFRGRAGSASLSFIPHGSGSLVHGNEILAGQILGYDRNKKLRQSDHTLENIVRAVENLAAGDQAFRDNALEQLASYVVLDALVGNTDRHHENWGMLEVRGTDRPQNIRERLIVAPSFDHASSLGRELRDEKRADILSQGRMEAYVRGGRGGIYLNSQDRHGANPLALAEKSARHFPHYFERALSSVSRFALDEVITIVDRVPEPCMSNLARRFSTEFLHCTQTMLKRLLL